jgi:hypothetical protein
MVAGKWEEKNIMAEHKLWVEKNIKAVKNHCKRKIL